MDYAISLFSSGEWCVSRKERESKSYWHAAKLDLRFLLSTLQWRFSKREGPWLKGALFLFL
jgi:hypothetical protein